MDAQQADSWVQMVKKHIKHMHKVIYRERMHNWNMQRHHIPTLQDIFWQNVAFGGLSASQVQHISMMPKLDDIKHATMDKWSSLGSTGKHWGNIHRDLLRFMNKYVHPIVQPEADCVKIPLKILKGEHTGTHNLHHYYLAPHKLMSFMYNNFKTAFQDKNLGP